jgi:hypothetical protein
MHGRMKDCDSRMCHTCEGKGRVRVHSLNRGVKSECKNVAFRL